METESTCTRCGVPFTWERKHKEVRLYCPPCRQETRKVQLDEARAKYAQSDRGKATNAASTRRWTASEKGRQYTAEWARTPQRREWLRQWRRAEERQRLHREWFRGYRETIAYRLPSRVRAHARGGYSVERLAVVARDILEGRAACYSCGCSATEIDHVLPVKLAALFGLFDEVDNYVSAMCKSCHRAKSVMDTRDIKRCRRELLTMPEQA